MRNRRGFTLIELLVVVSIMSLLISILIPSLGEAKRQSKRAVCMANLHQIGVGIQAYLDQHDQTFPYVARLLTEEEAIAKSEKPPRKPYPVLPVAFKIETGGSGKLFECPADRNTMMPELGFEHYYEAEKTSYEWEGELNGKRPQFKSLLMLKDQVKCKPKDMWMVFDIEPFHGGPKRMGSQCTLYADMSVRYDKWNEKKTPGKN